MDNFSINIPDVVVNVDDISILSSAFQFKGKDTDDDSTRTIKISGPESSGLRNYEITWPSDTPATGRGLEVASTSYDPTSDTQTVALEWGVDNSLFVQDSAGGSGTNDNNIYGGTNAGGSLSTGTENFFGGVNAGADVSTGTSNVFLGNTTGQSCTVGSENVGLGAGAITSMTGDSNNVAVGFDSLLNLDGGSNNIGIGHSAGTTGTTNSQCIIIGSGADVSGASVQNEIVIGYSATGKGSNTALIGNASTTDVYIGQSSNFSPPNLVLIGDDGIDDHTTKIRAPTGIGTYTDIELVLPADTPVPGEVLAVNSTGGGVATLEWAPGGAFVESGTNSIYLSHDVTIGGDLIVNGTTTTINNENLDIQDTLITCAVGNNNDIVDSGLLMEYNDGSSTKYAGIVREASNKIIQVVDSLTSKSDPVSSANLAPFWCGDIRINYNPSNYTEISTDTNGISTINSTGNAIILDTNSAKIRITSNINGNYIQSIDSVGSGSDDLLITGINASQGSNFTVDFSSAEFSGDIIAFGYVQCADNRLTSSGGYSEHRFDRRIYYRAYTDNTWSTQTSSELYLTDSDDVNRTILRGRNDSNFKTFMSNGLKLGGSDGPGNTSYILECDGDISIHGVLFPSGGNTLFNFFNEESNASMLSGGPAGSNSSTINFYVSRVNDMVNISWDETFVTGNGSSTGKMTIAYTLPSEYRPTDDVYLTIPILDGGSPTIGWFRIQTTGVMELGTTNNANFTANSTLNGPYAGGGNYNIL